MLNSQLSCDPGAFPWLLERRGLSRQAVFAHLPVSYENISSWFWDVLTGSLSPHYFQGLNQELLHFCRAERRGSGCSLRSSFSSWSGSAIVPQKRPLEQCFSDAWGQAGICPWNPGADVVSSHLEPFPPHQQGHNHPHLCRRCRKYPINCCQLSEVLLGVNYCLQASRTLGPLQV